MKLQMLTCLICCLLLSGSALAGSGATPPKLPDPFGGEGACPAQVDTLKRIAEKCTEKEKLYVAQARVSVCIQSMKRYLSTYCKEAGVEENKPELCGRARKILEGGRAASRSVADRCFAMDGA